MTSCSDISQSFSSEFSEPETVVLGFSFETFEAESRLPGKELAFTVGHSKKHTHLFICRNF